MFVVCTACRRHVRAEDAACPFCGGRGRAPEAPSVPAAGRRLDRLSLMTFTSLAASLAACASGPAANTGGAPTASSAAPEGSVSSAPSASTSPSTTASATPSTSAAPTASAPPIPPMDTSPVVNAPMYGAPPPFNAPGPGVGAYGAPSTPGLVKGPQSTVVLTKSPPGEGDLRHVRAHVAGMRACHQQVLFTDPFHKATCKVAVTLGGGAPAKATVTCTPASPTLEPCLKKRLEAGANDDGPAHTFDAALTFSPQN